jgi:aspartate-semialdehyde dehydrogenase
MKEFPKVAVVGASGAVGEVMLSILAEMGFRENHVTALASARSVGEDVEFGNTQLSIDDLDTFDFSGIEYALFSAGSSVSEKYAPVACKAGAIVIDNTSAFRYDPNIPLVVPEVNAHQLDKVVAGTIIANPNCSTIQMVVALAPIQRAAGIARINVATYQSVSGAGRKGLEELAIQTSQRLSFKDPDVNAFAQPIAFNVLPQIDSLQENGYSREEMKMVWETQKIFEDDSVLVNATAVRVPVFYGHAEAVHLETREDISLEEVSALLEKAPGVKLLASGDPADHPTPVTHAAGHDPVFVGRLRRDITHPRGIAMWVVSDNIRKGAALNAVQIMEYIERRTGKGRLEQEASG